MSGPELAFLPAAREIRETPPAPAGRFIALAIAGFFSLALVWAWAGKVEVVATAPGRIVPGDRVKRIAPLEIGVVRRIRVTEGSTVARGQVLVELDATDARAERSRLETALAGTVLALARLRALDRWAETGAGERDGEAANRALARALAGVAAGLPAGSGRPGDPDPGRRDRAARMLRSEHAAYRARVAELGAELARRRAAVARVRADVRKHEQTLPLIARRAAALGMLVAKGMAGEQGFLELEQRRIERGLDLIGLRRRLVGAAAEVDAARHRGSAHGAEHRRRILERMAEAEARIQDLLPRLATADRRAGLRRLASPVDGVVTGLAVHTPGGVVTPAQELMRVVPADGGLEVEAWLANKDIGLVRKGMAATVKVEAFPFTRYGTVGAEVAGLARDAVAREGAGLVYGARVRLARSSLAVDGRAVDLAPGMAVTVEIETGRRRIIEFLLGPLLRGLSEAAREP